MLVYLQGESVSRKRVGVLGKTFVEWSGGVDFITYLANAIAANDAYEVYLFVPDSNEALHLYEYKPPRYLHNRLKARYRRISPYTLMNPAKPQLGNVLKKIKIIYYRNNLDGFFYTLFKYKIDIVIPTTETLGKSFPKPWVGYIWDFQHRHLPQYFSAGDIKGRDVAFKNILNDSYAVLVNSKQTKEDIYKFLPSAARNKKIVSLPFAPNLDSSWLKISGDQTAKKYGIPNPYIIICNQFWVHKSHPTAIEAFAKLCKSHPKLHLVCTGKMEEPRYPNYISQVRQMVKRLHIDNEVHFMGYISKDDQIGLLKRALLLIQPTLYEGGPGGGAAYNAVALGIPMVISDIPVNLEIKNNSRVTFFKAGSSEDLADKIESVISHKERAISNSVLRDASKKNLLELSTCLSNLLETTISKSRRN